MHNTQVKDFNDRRASYHFQRATLQEAAEMMDAVDCAFCQLVRLDKLEGIITDRDIYHSRNLTRKDPEKDKL